MQRSQWMRRAGRWSFTLAWIPFTLIFVGMIGMPDGDYGWAELPLLTRFGLVATGLLFVSSFALQIGSSLIGSSENRNILENGLPAQATVLEISDTGTTINENPVVSLRLQVQPHDMPAFEAVTEKLISRLQIPQFQPGATVNVRYDPHSEAVALVDE